MDILNGDSESSKKKFKMNDIELGLFVNAAISRPDIVALSATGKTIVIGEFKHDDGYCIHQDQ